MIDKGEMLRELATFFLEEFEGDPDGVGDWVAQGPHDVDEFIESARAFAMGSRA